MINKMTLRQLAALCGLFLLVGTVLGLWAGFVLYRPGPVAVEVPAAAVMQNDKSVVLERAPDATAKPAHQVPAGAKVERIVRVKVRGKPAALPAPASAETVESADAADCPPVDVDLSLVKMPDETRRVVVSAGEGEVLGGVDIPVSTAVPKPPPLMWAAGISYSSDRRGGVWVDRDVGPFRSGLEIVQGDSGVTGILRIGIRF